ERQSIRLSAISHYAGRSHFEPWGKITGGLHDHSNPNGVFTPLVYVELETTDVPCDPHGRVEVRGESRLARTEDATGAIRQLIRQGRHTILDSHGTMLGRALMVNVFTRYHVEPGSRRVTELPPELGLGTVPSRITELVEMDSMIDLSREPDFAETQVHVWHYGDTDPNRHVNGGTYVRTMDAYIADVLHHAGHDLRR